MKLEIQIRAFYKGLPDDSRLSACHVSLYCALLIIWDQNAHKSPFRTTRRTLMNLSKIGSAATYHKCIKDLIGLGYIQYEPTYNPFIGTRINLLSISDKITAKFSSESSYG